MNDQHDQGIDQVQTHPGTGTVSQQRWSHSISTDGPERLLFDGIVVGTLEPDRVLINLGWAKAAGLHVRIEADPAVDHKRGGIVLDR